MNKVFCILLIAILAVPQTGLTKKKDKKAAALASSVKTDDYTKATKGAKKAQGVFTVYLNKDGKLYFEIPDSAFRHLYILANRISSTSNTHDFVAGQMINTPMLIRFSQDSIRVYMHEVHSEDIVDQHDPISKAFKTNFADPVLKGFKIVARHHGNALIDVTNFFGGNEKSISPIKPDNPLSILLGGQKNLKGSFDADASGVKEVKAFPRNIEILSTLNYNLTPENKPYTVEVHRSLFLAPDEPMKVRLHDRRVGFFSTEKKVYSSSKDKIEEMSIINRWRLEPKDSAAYFRGELVEPKKPIVYYVDTAFPEKWRSTVKQGIMDWNKAFEAAGFKNAIIAKDYPTDDPNFDPDDMRYNCVKYAVTETANAMGPRYIDPRTGEILTADVIWYHNVVSLLHNWRFVQTGAVDKRTHQHVFDDELMRESMRYVASHEIGHTLGLMHNMGASYAFPVDSLRSPSFTQKYGTTPSIMDYARNNYIAQPGDMEKGVRMTPPILGVADIYAINWGYRLIKDANAPEAEKTTLDKWIKEKAGDPKYEFGAQQFMSTVDPTDQTEDLGNDHVRAGNYAISNLKIIMKHLEEWTREPGESYKNVADMYKEVVKQYRRHLGHVMPYLGGIVFHEIRQGDHGYAKTYIDKNTQHRAMEWLVKQARTYKEWLAPSDLLNKFNEEDMTSIHISGSVISAIYGSTKLQRIQEGYQVNPNSNYNIKDYMSDAFNEIFRPTLQGKSLTEEDMELESQTIDFFKKMSGLGQAEEKPKGLFSLHGMSEEKLLPCDNWNPDHSFMRINYGLPSLPAEQLKPLMLSQIKKVKALLLQRRGTGDSKTRDFYEYKILEINKLLKI